MAAPTSVWKRSTRCLRYLTDHGILGFAGLRSLRGQTTLGRSIIARAEGRITAIRAASPLGGLRVDDVIEKALPLATRAASADK